MMTIDFLVDIRESVRGGYSVPQGRECRLQIDPATMDQHDRDLLATRLDDWGTVSHRNPSGCYVVLNDRGGVRHQNPAFVGSERHLAIVAAAPTLEAVLDAIRREEEAAIAAAEAKAKEQAEAKAKEEAERAAKAAEWGSRPTAELVYTDTYGQTQVCSSVRIYTPHRLAEAEAELARRKAEIEAARAAKEAAEAAELAALREWAEKNGSELTRARLAEGFDSWISSARSDRAEIVAADGRAARLRIMEATGLRDLEEPEGEESDEPRKSPTLAEIVALRKIRDALPVGGSVSLVRRAYTETVEELDDEGCPEEVERVKRLTIAVIRGHHEFGEWTGEIVLPG